MAPGGLAQAKVEVPARGGGVQNKGSPLVRLLLPVLEAPPAPLASPASFLPWLPLHAPTWAILCPPPAQPQPAPADPASFLPAC